MGAAAGDLWLLRRKKQVQEGGRENILLLWRRISVSVVNWQLTKKSFYRPYHIVILSLNSFLIFAARLRDVGSGSEGRNSICWIGRWGRERRLPLGLEQTQHFHQCCSTSTKSGSVLCPAPDSTSTLSTSGLTGDFSPSDATHHPPLCHLFEIVWFLQSCNSEQCTGRVLSVARGGESLSWQVESHRLIFWMWDVTGHPSGRVTRSGFIYYWLSIKCFYIYRVLTSSWESTTFQILIIIKSIKLFPYQNYKNVQKTPGTQSL